MDCSPPGSSVHGDSPGKNTGVGCHALLQGIFLTQGLNLGLPHCRRILPFEPPGKPKIAGVGSLSLLQGNSLTGNQTGVYWVSAAAAAKSLQSCPTVRPHRRQPTRLLCPWDSPGKNTGVGCHFLLKSMKVRSESEVAQSCPTLSNPMVCSLPGSFCPWDFPGKSTGVGCHYLLRLSICYMPNIVLGVWNIYIYIIYLYIYIYIIYISVNCRKALWSTDNICCGLWNGE